MCTLLIIIMYSKGKIIEYYCGIKPERNDLGYMVTSLRMWYLNWTLRMKAEGQLKTGVYEKWGQVENRIPHSGKSTCTDPITLASPKCLCIDKHFVPWFCVLVTLSIPACALSIIFSSTFFNLLIIYILLDPTDTFRSFLDSFLKQRDTFSEA